MKKRLYLIALIFCLIPSVVFAEDIYLAAIQQGDGSGISCATAKAASWFNTSNNWGTGSNKISPGDNVILCNDGGDYHLTLTTHGSGSPGNEITITNESGAIATIDGQNSRGWGIRLQHNYIIIDGSNGLNSVAGRGIVIKNHAGAEPESGRSAIYNEGSSHNLVRNVSLECPYGRCLHVEDGSTYFTLLYSTIDTTVGNTSYQNDLTYWGTGNNHTVKYCNFIERKTGGHYIDGIQTFQTDGPFTIAYNHFQSESGYSSGSDMFLQFEDGNAGEWQVYNNVLFMDDVSQQPVIFDNNGGMIYFENNTVVNMDQGAVDHLNDSDGVQCRNNIFWSGGSFDYKAEVGLSSRSQLDYDLYYKSNDGENGKVFYDGSDKTWSQLQEAGYEAHGVYGNPQFVDLNGRDFHLKEGSPAIDAGTSNVHCGFTDDFDGNPRGSNWEIGAYAYNATSGVPDTDPPTVPTSLAASNITQNSALLSWNASTDNRGVAGYHIFRNGQLHDTTTTTSYSDTNLNPSTQYTYQVSAYDSAGNESSKSASLAITTDSLSYFSPGEYIEAESGDMSSPMQIGSDGNASGGKYVYTNVENSGSVSFVFDITEAGTYTLRAKVSAVDDGQNSFYVSVDNEPANGNDTYAYDTIISNSFVWDNLSLRGPNGDPNNSEFDPMSWNLTPGLHTFTFYGREINTRLDQIILNSISDVPPSPPANFKFGQ